VGKSSRRDGATSDDVVFAMILDVVFPMLFDAVDEKKRTCRGIVLR
jgi:hypothetical protein